MAESTLRDVLRERVAHQLLCDATTVEREPADVARAVCGVQAQALDAGFASLGVRGRGLTEAAVARAHGPGRTLVRVWLMRGTLHLVAADDARWLLRLFGPLNAARDATRRAQTGLDDALCERAIASIRRALSDGPLTRHQLRDWLEARGITVPHGQAMIHLLALAAYRGVLVLTEQIGRFNTFALLDDVVQGDQTALRRERAETELARRYFAAYAPAGLADFRTWSGLPMSVARPAVAAIGDELEPVPAPIPGLMRLRSSERFTADGRAPSVRLLPYFDTYLLGYRNRDAMIQADRTAHIYSGGWINPTLSVDGHLEGAWRLRRGSREAVVELTPFGTLQRGVPRLLQDEVGRLGRFLEMPARLETASAVP